MFNCIAEINCQFIDIHPCLDSILNIIHNKIQCIYQYIINGTGTTTAINTCKNVHVFDFVKLRQKRFKYCRRMSQILRYCTSPGVRPINLYSHHHIHSYRLFFLGGGFNATFSNISAISWRPILVVEEAGVSGENHRPNNSN